VSDYHPRRKPPRRTEQPESTAGRDSYLAFVRRSIAAFARRAESGDTDALEGLLALESELRTAITSAGAALHAAGYSWAEIAQTTGASRQAAQARFGRAGDTPLP
jgi:hypothetical protein